MAFSIVGKPTTKRRRAAMHAALYTARENRRERVAKEAADHITYSASPPNPDVMSGTQGDGKNH